MTSNSKFYALKTALKFSFFKRVRLNSIAFWYLLLFESTALFIMTGYYVTISLLGQDLSRHDPDLFFGY